MRRDSLSVDRFGSAEECRDYFKSCYGPTINAYRYIAEDPELVAGLDAEIAELCRRHLLDGVMEWEYLVVIAHRS